MILEEYKIPHRERPAFYATKLRFENFSRIDCRRLSQDRQLFVRLFHEFIVASGAH